MAKKKIEINPEVLEARKIIDRLLEEYKQEEKEYAEFEALCNAKSEEIQKVLDERAMRTEAKLAYIQGQIRGYYAIAEPKETDTQSKLDLVCGTVKIKKAKGDYGKDLNKLLDWARTNGREDLIETKETHRFKWAEFKATLSIQADSVIDKETGEVLVIDGLGVIEKPEELVIE